MMKTIFIESDLSSFEDFYDSDWVVELEQLVKSTDIEGIVEDFTAHWWGSARAFVLPWLLVNGVYDSVNTFRPTVASRQDLWNEYLKTYTFRAALWKLAEGMYCSIYYAYENLIVNLLKEIRVETIRVTDWGFNKELTAVYGDKFADRIWNTNFISVSREVRNCIVHNGGKPTDKLLRMKPHPYISGGDILISASDTRELYKELKPLIREVISESLREIRKRDLGA